MAALLGCGCFPPSPLLHLHSPAKFTCRTLRTPPLLLLHRPFSAKPISRAAAQSRQKYVYPDPNPPFAQFETNKFRTELRKKLSKEKETFGDALDEVVEVCSQIFNSFLHKDYGGPGTLLVEPFTDMLVALRHNKLPGAPSAARTALLWAQNHVDEDWEDWSNSNL